MAINFKNIAQKATVLSDIMANRSKVDKKDGVITIVDFDIVSNPKGEAYAICAIDDKHFINGGYVLTKIFTDIIAEFDGDVEAAREEYRASELLRVKLTRNKTKAGRDITNVEVL